MFQCVFNAAFSTEPNFHWGLALFITWVIFAGIGFVWLFLKILRDE